MFTTIADAEQAVCGLLAAGFSKDEITVVCSDQAKERWFREFEHQDPAGSKTPAAAATGGVIGAALGGFAVLAFSAATGGVGLLAAGGLATWTGGIVGGLMGAMMTRGVEKELANYYDQSVAAGKLLVAVESHAPDQTARLARAEGVLAEAGAQPQPLAEG